MGRTRLEKLLQDKDIAVIEAIISHLRSQAPRLVPTAELSYVIRRSPSQVYGLIKKGREYLSMTTGEFIPNHAKRKTRKIYGYTVNKDPRAAEHEALKSFNRGAGHFAQGIATHQRVAFEDLKTPRDKELWMSNQHVARGAQFVLDAIEESRRILATNTENKRLAAFAQSDAKTPWEVLGLDNPDNEPDQDDEAA